MEKKEFTVQPLLGYNELGRVTGPFSPVMGVRMAMEDMKENWNRLARVCFDDREINNWYEGQGKRDLTYCDTLIAAQEYSDGTLACMVLVDCGTHMIPAALWLSTDSDVTLTPIYLKTELARRLTAEEVVLICNTAIQDGSFRIQEYQTLNR